MNRFRPIASPLQRFLLLIGVGVIVTIVTGAVYGRLTQRWGPVPDLVAAARHLQSLPSQIGDWQIVSEDPIDEHILEILSCAGHIHRKYVNRKSGETVDIAIIVGPSGPISVHTPEICYSSRAYTIQEPRALVPIADPKGRLHSFWSLAFRTNNALADQLRVYYAWSADGTWTAAESPRFEFAGKRALYKLQMSTLAAPSLSNEEQDACRKFLSALLRSSWKTNG